MPYIRSPETKKLLRGAGTANNPGELNFVITNSVDNFLDKHGVNYTTLNTAIGALECAKLELYRRIAAPYENGKMAENGDVYTVKP